VVIDIVGNVFNKNSSKYIGSYPGGAWGAHNTPPPQKKSMFIMVFFIFSLFGLNSVPPSEDSTSPLENNLGPPDNIAKPIV